MRTEGEGVRVDCLAVNSNLDGYEAMMRNIKFSLLEN
jgi:hypothetical protein